MSDLREYFDTMSKFAAISERAGNIKDAQETRDTRNNSWDRGIKAEIRYHHAMKDIK
jgi:hypothetical protein